MSGPGLLVHPVRGVKYRRLLEDGRQIDVRPAIYTWQLLIGDQADTIGYEDQWCYKTELQALAAMLGWDGEGEPPGWFRHPTSGRRREDGDPAREVQWW